MSVQFRLSDEFIEQYKNRAPPFGPLGKITYKTKYARPIYEEDRLEEWWETIRRVVEGCYTIQRRHCENLKLNWNFHKAARSGEEMYDRMFNMKFLPAGRGLKMMGTDFMWERTPLCLISCTFISTNELSTDFAEPFCFIMDVSMLGCGSAIDTRGAGQVKIREPRITEDVFVVEDSREGWIEFIRTVLNAYVSKGAIPINVDYSKVRPYGSPIKGLGGTASGSLPLKQLYVDIQNILNPAVGNQISSTNIVDLANAVAKCVVSGNLRRSAQACLGREDDQAFLELKDPDKNTKRLDAWGWNSNNSVIARIGMDYKETGSRAARNGEPGFFWIANARSYGRMADPENHNDAHILGSNACQELPLPSYGTCNLVETFPALHEDYEDYERSLKYAYLYAKTVTLLPTHNPRVNAVILNDRRIGISQSGIVQSIQKIGMREHLMWCDKGYKYLRKTDKTYSQWFCVQESIKVSTCKPAGTTSLLNGSTPGVHYPFNKYYYRTMRFDKGSSIVNKLKECGYRVEDDVIDENSAVAYFPIKETNFSRARKDVPMWEQLELTAQLQHWWSDNSVSVTVTFNPEEAQHIPRALELYETRLKSVSFLPLQDHKYKQAPYIEITKKEYKEAIANLKPFDFNDLEIEKYYKHEYCNSEHCETTPTRAVEEKE